MDEASAAQTIEQPCTPHSGFPYTRFSFWNLQSMGLRWRSWVQSSCGESAASNLTQANFRAEESGAACFVQGHGAHAAVGLATSPNDSFAPYIEA
jgi:hypothetical protein